LPNDEKILASFIVGEKRIGGTRNMKLDVLAEEANSV
jgi:hypothetical protein